MFSNTEKLSSSESKEDLTWYQKDGSNKVADVLAVKQSESYSPKKKHFAILVHFYYKVWINYCFFFKMFLFNPQLIDKNKSLETDMCFYFKILWWPDIQLAL